jgi:hypothetical protein
MSNSQEFTKLIPAQGDDIDEIVSFYEHEITFIQNGMKTAKSRGEVPRQMVLWDPFTPEQVAEIINQPHSKFLLLREQLGKSATGKLVGGVIVDKEFSAWGSQELLPPDPLHFARFLADHTIQHLGRDVLFKALLDFATENNTTALYAEAWDFTYDQLPEDKLKRFYTGLGMKHLGTVIYKNDRYGRIIGRDRPVNRFVYEMP